MDTTLFLPFSSALPIDTVEQATHQFTVHLHATSLSVACPRCGTPGSRIHSRYVRTIADVAFGGQRLVLKLRVRTWVCSLIPCPQHLFAERFPDLVHRYARMTDRLIQTLQSVGVTTNGADGARLLSLLAMPTTGKTIIRRVLELPLPEKAPVRVAGIDEWAWKKGSRYGTILVDLEHRRVVDLLSERSVETSTVWFKNHPEVDIISRDRGKIFRDAASAGAPQAKQVVDRFHLQKNFAQALEKFFAHHMPLLKKAAQHLTGKALPSQKIAPTQATQERERHHAERVRRHKKIWKLFRAGRRKEEIARIVGLGSRSVHRVLEHEQPPAPETRHHTHHMTDPYLSYLSRRWNEGCHTAVELYDEVRAQGYPGSLRTIEKIVKQFRHSGTHPVSKQSVVLQKVPSPRSVGLMVVRPAEHRTQEQGALLEQLWKMDATLATACTLAQSFGQLLRKQEGPQRLDRWKGDVQTSGIPELLSFVDGLTDDAEAVAQGCTMSWNNGMVEGFVNKVKWIKRSSYGQAGFALLQRRVLLHPATGEAFRTSQRSESPRQRDAGSSQFTSATFTEARRA